MSIYMKMPHRADIYKKSFTTSPAGQKKASWSKNQVSVKCFYVPQRPTEDDNRTKPTYEQWVVIQMFFPAEVNIDSGSRIYNITDRFGSVIETGPLEITQITKQSGFSGKIHHVMVLVQKVVED